MSKTILSILKSRLSLSALSADRQATGRLIQTKNATENNNTKTQLIDYQPPQFYHNEKMQHFATNNIIEYVSPGNSHSLRIRP